MNKYIHVERLNLKFRIQQQAASSDRSGTKRNIPSVLQWLVRCVVNVGERWVQIRHHFNAMARRGGGNEQPVAAIKAATSDASTIRAVNWKINKNRRLVNKNVVNTYSYKAKYLYTKIKGNQVCWSRWFYPPRIFEWIFSIFTGINPSTALIFRFIIKTNRT